MDVQNWNAYDHLLLGNTLHWNYTKQPSALSPKTTLTFRQDLRQPLPQLDLQLLRPDLEPVGDHLVLEELLVAAALFHVRVDGFLGGGPQLRFIVAPAAQKEREKDLDVLLGRRAHGFGDALTSAEGRLGHLFVTVGQPAVESLREVTQVGFNTVGFLDDLVDFGDGFGADFPVLVFELVE